MTFATIGTKTFVLPIGTLKISELVSALNSCSSLDSITMASLGTWTYAAATSLLTFTASGSYAFVDIRFYNRLGRIMGWDFNVRDAAYLTQGYFKSTSPTSISCVNMTISNAIWVTCDLARDQSQSTFTSAISSMYVNDRPAQAYIVYQNPDPQATAKVLSTFEPETLNDYSPQLRLVTAVFSFLYDDGTIANFNGVHWDMVVRTWREEPTYELFRRYVNMEIEWMMQAAPGSINAYGQPAGLQIPIATDFRTNQTASSRYRFRQVWQEGGQGTVGFGSASSTTDVIFRFGAGYLINLAETRLRITEAYQAVASSFNHVRAIPPIRAVRLQTSSGVVLVDIQRLDVVHAMISPFLQKRTEAICDAKGIDSSTTAGSALGYGQLVNKATTQAGGPLIMSNQRGVDNAHLSMEDNTRLLPAMGDWAFPRDYITDTAITDSSTTWGAATPNTGGLILQWDMPLRKLLPHTMCQILQDLYFGTDLMLTLTFEATNNRGFVVPAAAMPVVPSTEIYPSAASSTAYISGTGISLTQTAGPNTQWSALASVNATVTAAGSINLSYRPDVAHDLGHTTLGTTFISAVNPLTSLVPNTTGGTPQANAYVCNLLLATQDNLDLVNSVKSEIGTTGIRIPSQSLLILSDPGPSTMDGKLFSRVARLNIPRGASILRWYHGIGRDVVPTASGISAHRRFPFVARFDNLFANTWSDYRTYLNSVPMSDSAQTVQEQWKRTVYAFKDSVVAPYLAWLQKGGIQVEDFTSGFDLTKATPEGGLPLANPIDIQLDTTLGASLNDTYATNTGTSYWAFVMLKYLSISAAGVSYESA